MCLIEPPPCKQASAPVGHTQWIRKTSFFEPLLFLLRIQLHYITIKYAEIPSLCLCLIEPPSCKQTSASVGHTQWIRKTSFFEPLLSCCVFNCITLQLNTQRYRSGHNGADSKSVWEQSHEGSNPSLCARNLS